MTFKNDNTIHIEYQGYVCEKIENDEKGNQILKFKSERKATKEICPHCGGKVSGNGIRKVTLALLKNSFVIRHPTLRTVLPPFCYCFFQYFF